jgi:hypothetical protein
MNHDYYVKQCHEYIDRLEKCVKEAAEKAQKASFDFARAKIMQLEPYKMPNTSFTVDYPIPAQSKADSLYEQDKAVRERNKIASENNRNIKEALIILMTNLGFSETTRQRKTRSSYKLETVKAQWRDYLDLAPIDLDGGRIDDIYKRWCEQIEKKKKETTEKHEADKRKREADEKEKDKLKLLVTIGIKYDQDFRDIDDAIQYILSKDKYLHLAYYLEKNRGDWSDGCDYARIGLGGFKIDTPEDHLIFKEITDLCEDFEDGRCFRDCEWNYGRLFEMSKKELLDDLSKLTTYMDR